MSLFRIFLKRVPFNFFNWFSYLFNFNWFLAIHPHLRCLYFIFFTISFRPNWFFTSIIQPRFCCLFDLASSLFCPVIQPQFRSLYFIFFTMSFWSFLHDFAVLDFCPRPNWFSFFRPGYSSTFSLPFSGLIDFSSIIHPRSCCLFDLASSFFGYVYCSF